MAFPNTRSAFPAFWESEVEAELMHLGADLLADGDFVRCGGIKILVEKNFCLCGLNRVVKIMDGSNQNEPRQAAAYLSRITLVNKIR